ncbi:MAG: enoyl-CoA hydratase-related protein [Acidimicrobiales bacterium]
MHDDLGAPASARSISAAVLSAGAAIENASTAIQVLGGMGFTWDMLPNHLLKRAWTVDHDFGVIEEHEMPGRCGAGEPVRELTGHRRDLRRQRGRSARSGDRPARPQGSLRPVDVLALVGALEAAATDDTLRVVVVRRWRRLLRRRRLGGHEHRQGAQAPDRGIQRRTPLQAHTGSYALLQEIQLPVVCAVRGWAAGLGCQIALASDFAVATDTSSFWLPFVKRGFTPDSGSSWLVPRLVGVARAKEMLLLGRPVSGRDAAAWGMIHRAVADAEFEPTVDALVDELARAATVAVGLTKREIHRALTSSLAEAMETESTGLELSSRTGDFREGLKAFREKRDPDFEGR